MISGRLLRAALVGIAVLILAPDPLWAWTPGTHIWLAESILGNLHLLPPQVADLLHAFPFDFLYGTIAPDTSLAKKYVPPGRHSHYWKIGREVFEQAESDALKAFGLGYLSHLAADTVAHNFYVPRQLFLTSSTRTMGHSYWELRAETQLTDTWARKARDLIVLDHQAADRHLERIISPTIFSVRTNRRLFKGMVHLAHTRSWQRAMTAARERSRWILTDTDVERHLGAAYDVTMEMLIQPKVSPLALNLDPIGARSIRHAKQMRRSEVLRGVWFEPDRLLPRVEEEFGLPRELPGFWQDSTIIRPWLPAEDQPESSSTAASNRSASSSEL